jgi:TolB-like protein
MKRCPQCGREYDVTMSYCLDDGSELLYGPAGVQNDEPRTAILNSPPFVSKPDAEVTRILSGNPQAVPADGGQSKTNKFLAVAGLAAIVLGFAFLGYRYWPASGKQIDSVAVMPFLNASGDANVEYLSDGMAETLIRSLSQLPGLNVKSRSSAFRYKGTQTDVRTIGKELGVQAILNGRVVQAGDSLRLSLELINADNENIIWTDSYDRKLTDLVGLQNDIARDVSGKLRLKLTNAEEQKLAKNYTADPEVYRLYLQGRFYWNKRTPAEVTKAIPFFKQAVEQDPNFALGYVGLADSDEDTDRPQKKEYIRRALEIDPDLAEAHASLGYQYMLDYDWAVSERELKRAMELNPKYPQSYAWNGARLMMIGRYDEAIASIDQALLIEPASNGFNFYKGVCLGASGRYDESIDQFKRTIALDPTFPWPHSHLARIYRLKGDLAAAAEERAVSLELDGSPEVAKGIRERFAKSGWEAVQDYIRTQDPRRFGILQTRYEKEGWIQRLQEQAANGSFWLFLIKTDPIFDPLRGDPRFEVLVHKFDPPA